MKRGPTGFITFLVIFLVFVLFVFPGAHVAETFLSLILAVAIGVFVYFLPYWKK